MIEKILEYSQKQGCSDVHITAGSVPMIRVDGDIREIPNAPILTSQQVSDMFDVVMTEGQKQTYKKELELDFAIQVGETLRFRANVFHTINGPAAVFREIPAVIKTLDELETPEIIRDLCSSRKGLILMVGPTGSGKSTTSAAFLDFINSKYAHHIITIEDPVEFVHKNKKSLINQREVGVNTKSFSNALRSALREDPDVIMVGELRDIETIELALTAAETGHLVIGTLHTNSASQTINRIIDVFPPQDKPLVRTMLSTSIKAVISQRLIKKDGGGRIAAYEVMVSNVSIRNMIREDKIPQINSVIELGRKQGMLLMKDSINDLLSKNIITKEVAEEAIRAND